MRTQCAPRPMHTDVASNIRSTYRRGVARFAHHLSHASQTHEHSYHVHVARGKKDDQAGQAHLVAEMRKAATLAAKEMQRDVDVLKRIADELPSKRHKEAEELRVIAERMRMAAYMLLAEGKAGNAETIRHASGLGKVLLNLGATAVLGLSTGAGTVLTTEYLRHHPASVGCMQQAESAAERVFAAAPIDMQINITEDDDTITGSGAVTGAPDSVSGSVNVSLPPATLRATGTVGGQGTFSGTAEVTRPQDIRAHPGVAKATGTTHSPTLSVSPLSDSDTSTESQSIRQDNSPPYDLPDLSETTNQVPALDVPPVDPAPVFPPRSNFPPLPADERTNADPISNLPSAVDDGNEFIGEAETDTPNVPPIVQPRRPADTPTRRSHIAQVPPASPAD